MKSFVQDDLFLHHALGAKNVVSVLIKSYILTIGTLIRNKNIRDIKIIIIIS